MENKGSEQPNEAPKNEDSRQYDDKIKGLEKDVSKLKSKERSRTIKDRVRLYSGLAGAAGALAGTKIFLEDSLRGIGESVGGAVDAVNTAKKYWRFPKRGKKYKVVKKINYEFID